MSETNNGIPIEVNPTITLQASVEMGSRASENNAEAWAVGERGGVPVSSTDQTYHNNAKHYAQVAEDAAETASAAYGTDLLAPTYSATKTYAVGDHVIYDGGYYACNTAITTAEAWTAAHWTRLTVGGEASDLKSAIQPLWKRVYLEAQWFISKGFYSAGSQGTYDYSACSVTELLNFAGVPFSIKSTNNNIVFAVVNLSNNETTGWISEYTNFTGLNIVINSKTNDRTNYKTEYLDYIEFYVPAVYYEQVYNMLHIEITNSRTFPEFNLVDGIIRYRLLTSGEMTGMLERNHTTERVTVKSFYSKEKLTIIVGRYDNATVTVKADNISKTINQGQWLEIPANTLFVAWFTTTNTGNANPVPSNVICITENSKPQNAFSQYVASIATHTDCFFIDENGLFYLINKEGTYTVYDGETEVKAATNLGHAIGHANNCNYSNGKVYISDWTDPTSIHVFSVNTSTYELTYTNDLLIPNEIGSCEYYVVDENQIFGLGWNSGNANTDPNYLILSLWIKFGTEFVKSYEKKIVRPEVLQGFTIQGDYIYYVDCNNTTGYPTKNINRINIITGETEYNNPLNGSILSNEAEGIVPLGNQMFLVNTYYGRMYITAFSLLA